MKKKIFNSDILETPYAEDKNTGLDKIKTTNINVLLNRVRISKKIEFKKRVIFLTLLLSFMSSLAIFFLFKY